MRCLRLPKKLVLELNGIIAKFWWGSGGEKKGIHWLSWDKFCSPKGSGGLNLRAFEDFNRALLAKQGWRILRNENSLATKIFKAKYFWNSDYLSAGLGSRPSFVWRSIIWGRGILEKGLICRIGDGRSVKIYDGN